MHKNSKTAGFWSGKLAAGSRSVVESLESRQLLTATVTTLASFDSSNGNAPSGLVADAAGNLYGTTVAGGTNNNGTVFELSGPNHQTLTTLVNFDGTNGVAPYSGLAIDGAGNLYGTTQGGSLSTNYGGTVFELSGPNHQTLTTLKEFINVSGLYTGSATGVLTFDAAGNLYGTDLSGTANNSNVRGSVFELSGPDHLTYSRLVTFAPVGGNNPYPFGGIPNGGLVADTAGNLYGVGSNGGTSDLGTVFELSGAGHQTVTTLANFNGANGANPEATLAFDAAGNLYGTTLNGGSDNHGTVFELSGPGFSTLTTLVNFNSSNGSAPYSTPLFDAQGNLYGTTYTGGANGGGTIFKLSGADHQALTTLFDFDASNGGGKNPNAGLISDGAGNFYGTTVRGGTGSPAGGTVFELSGVGAQNKLVVTQLPATVVAGQIITPAVTVSEEDANGNIITSGSAPVTLAIASGTAGAILGGTVTEPLVNGVATFSDLTISQIGNYTLAASDAADTTGTSNALAVTDVPTLVPLTGTSTVPAAVVAGLPAKGALAVTVTNALGTPLKGAGTINLFASTTGAIDGSSRLVSTMPVKVNLKAGQSKTFHLKVKSLPSSLASGVYTLFTQTVAPGGVINNAATGPTLQVAAAFVNLTDSIGRYTPATLKPGKSGTIAVTITNTGNVPTTGVATFDIGLSTDGLTQTTTLVTMSKALKIKSGKSKTIKIRLPIPANQPAGSYASFISVSQDGSTVSAIGQTTLIIG